MILVYLESPFAGEIAVNLAYARACMADCLARGEAPLASHLLYTQEGILRDDVPGERRLGIEAGFAWAMHAARTVVYVDRGLSSGVLGGIEAAQQAGRTIEFREFATDMVTIMDPHRRPRAITWPHTWMRVRFRDRLGRV